MNDPMFPLGDIILTPGALELLQRMNISPDSLIERHVLGDWGDDVTDDDKKTNDLALQMGGRILSAYDLSHGNTVWVTTEPDRSKTTILLPREH
jgi:hypothetical protein